MNVGDLRVLLEDLLVLGDGFIPVSLRLKGFGFELFRLMRCRSGRREILRGPGSEFRVHMSGSEEHVGIIRKLAVEQKQSFHCGFHLIETHGAASRRHHRAILELFVRKVRCGFLQQWQRLPAPAFGGKADASLSRGRSVHGRSFRGDLCRDSSKG